MLNKSGYREISLAQLVESPHNPRRRFSEKTLAELAASIEEHGILTPLLVRSQDGAFEIAAGHRRFRAAKMAGLVTVPAIVREMTDQQFMEVLTVENLQREDVHAYEEAQGYAELMKLPGYDVAAVAGKIGRSDAYVRSRLKLLNLIPEVAEAFLSDRITFAHARLIAPLSPDKQAEGLKECFAEWGKHPLLSASELREWISGEQGEDLADAPFALDDAELLPAAGACVVCPKSTCAEGRLFGDDQGEEICYDKKCFEAKTELHVSSRISAGFVAIAGYGGYGAKPVPGVVGAKEYTEIQEPRTPEEGVDQELDPDERSCPHAEDAVVVTGSNKGQTAKICRNPKCPIHGETAKEAAREERRSSSNSNGNGQHEDRQREQEEARKEQQKEWERRREIYHAIRADWQPNLHPTLGLLMVTYLLEDIYSSARLKVLCEEREIEAQDKPDLQRAALYVWAEKADAYELAELLVDLLLEPHIEHRSYETSYDLLTIASDQLGIPEKKPEPKKKAAKKKK